VDPAGLDIGKPRFNLLPNLDMVLDLLKRGVVRESIEKLSHCL